MGFAALLKGLREVLRSARRARPTKTRVLCPRCGSEELKLSSWLDGWLTPTRYYCQRCGYVGPIALEVDEESAQRG